MDGRGATVHRCYEASQVQQGGHAPANAKNGGEANPEWSVLRTAGRKQGGMSVARNAYRCVLGDTRTVEEGDDLRREGGEHRCCILPRSRGGSRRRTNDIKRPLTVCQFFHDSGQCSSAGRHQAGQRIGAKRLRTLSTPVRPRRCDRGRSTQTNTDQDGGWRRNERVDERVVGEHGNAESDEGQQRGDDESQ